MTNDPDSVSEIADLMSIRANNCLAINGITRITDLACLNPDYLLKLRGVGESSLKQFARALLQKHIVPGWLKPVAPGFRYSEACTISNEAESERLHNDGWKALTIPYARPEFWMLERVIADLQRSGIEYKLRTDFAGGPISVYRRDIIDVKPEELGKVLAAA